MHTTERVVVGSDSVAGALVDTFAHCALHGPHGPCTVQKGVTHAPTLHGVCVGVAAASGQLALLTGAPVRVATHDTVR